MFSVGIVAHEKRRSHAEALADKVNGFISWDDGTLGCDGNHLQVYRKLAGSQTPYSVVLEDDAIPIEDGFLEQLCSALLVAPAPVVSLYLGTSRPVEVQSRITRALKTASHTQACWIISRRLLHAVGVAIPTKSIPSLLAFIDQLPHRPPIDEAITHWAAIGARGAQSVCYTVPSLIDHRDEPTLFAHRDRQPRNQPRRAHHLGARSCWDSSFVRL